ncbi:hypothetical protein C8R43DRAFT_945693 [Mycena crocata]|nr:hypothetical protein C8R43DRAFT_945693 [Mycena crocata]
MAPTSTFNLAGRDLEADVASIFDQPEAFSLPYLLVLIGICVVGSIMVFILWRWNSVLFSDVDSYHKDLITQWKTGQLKPTVVHCAPFGFKLRVTQMVANEGRKQ